MMKFIRRDHIPTDRRPLGYWLRAIQGPLRDNMRGAFATSGVTRREWRTLTTLHAGPASAAEVEAALPPKRARRPLGPEHHIHQDRPHRDHRTIEQLLDGFVSRGWAGLDRGSYALSAEGERVHEAVLADVQSVRANVTAGIPDADYATTMATLERIAKNVGWDPEKRHGLGRGRGHGPHRGRQLKRGLV
jgi:hypothetical protein